METKELNRIAILREVTTNFHRKKVSQMVAPALRQIIKDGAITKYTFRGAVIIVYESLRTIEAGTDVGDLLPPYKGIKIMQYSKLREALLQRGYSYDEIDKIVDLYMDITDEYYKKRKNLGK